MSDLMKKNYLASLIAAPLLSATMSLAAETSVWEQSIHPLDKMVGMVVSRSATCGCCKKWVRYMSRHGFGILDNVAPGMRTVKDDAGVPLQVRSCHTAVVKGYVIEGHVPFEDIQRLLIERPKIVGLSVPGMVTGSPGMEMGERKDPFAVLSFDEQEKFRIYHEYQSY